MKSFRLQAVLDHRKQIENTAQKSLLRCLDEKSMLMHKKDDEQKKLQKLYQMFQQAKHNGMLIPEIMLYENCIDLKKNHLGHINQQLNVLDEKIKQKQSNLVEARKEKKILEIIRDNRQKEEKQKQTHRENVSLDEIAILCFGDRK
ncbi:MAG: flagellar export protein FliJ [Desulfobacterales bacterium]